MYLVLLLLVYPYFISSLNTYLLYLEDEFLHGNALLLLLLFGEGSSTTALLEHLWLFETQI